VTPDDKNLPRRLIGWSTRRQPSRVSDLYRRCSRHGLRSSRGADKEKAFYGVDQDSHASPMSSSESSRHKPLEFAENICRRELWDHALGGVAYIRKAKMDWIERRIMLSANPELDDSAMNPINPGVEHAYALAVPTYAANRVVSTQSCQ